MCNCTQALYSKQSTLRTRYLHAYRSNDQFRRFELSPYNHQLKYHPPPLWQNPWLLLYHSYLCNSLRSLHLKHAARKDTRRPEVIPTHFKALRTPVGPLISKSKKEFLIRPHYFAKTSSPFGITSAIPRAFSYKLSFQAPPFHWCSLPGISGNTALSQLRCQN